MNTDIEEIAISSFEIVENAVTPEEASVLTNSDDEFDEDRYLKASGKLLNNKPTPKGYGIHSNGLEYMVNHFQETKNVKRLHRMFKNHNFQDVDAKIGRITDLFSMDGYKTVDYEGILDTNDSSVKEKADTYDEVSATVFLNNWKCSDCETPLERVTRNRNVPIKNRFSFRCGHEPDGKSVYPEAHKAVHFETSPVTVGNYPTSIEVSSFSGIEEYIAGVIDEDDVDENSEENEGGNPISQDMEDVTVEGDVVTMSLSAFKEFASHADFQSMEDEEEKDDNEEPDEFDLDEAIVNGIINEIERVNKLDEIENQLNLL